MGKKKKRLIEDKKKNKIHKVTPTFSAKFLAKKREMGIKKTIHSYPYLMIISYYKTNVFFTLADMQGFTKTWTSTGQSGFKNKDKTTYMAVVRVMGLFLKKIWSLGIRLLILKFRNLYKRHARFAVRYTMRKFKRKYRFKYAGILVQNQMAFNGCRKRKKRRK